MTNVLVVAEFSESKLKKTTHSAITFAQSVAKGTGGTFSILVIGAGAKTAAAELTGFGAAKVLAADDASLANYLCERYSPTVVTTAKQGFGVVVTAASAFGKDLMPRVAAALDAGYATDISSVKTDGGKLVYRRPMFAGNAYGYCEITTPIQVVTVRQSEFSPAQPSGGSSPIESVASAPPAAGSDRIQFVSFDQVKNERPELTEASVVVSGGRALKERFKEVLDPLADALSAAEGASRAACDAGYAPSDLQVGQTG
jgi:electron transfer flavoprotein alpha subunit